MRSTKELLRSALGPTNRQRIWERLVDTRGLSHLYYLLDPDVRHLRLRRSTDLVIDGFPRSANTYTTEAIRLANPDLVLTHHLHQPRIVERAVARGIPTLILIRRPDEAAASFSHFSPESDPTDIYDVYSRYYERLLPLISHVVLADFDEVTSDLGLVLKAVRQRYQMRLATPGRENQDAIFNRVDAFSSEYFGAENFERKVSRPSEHRARALVDPTLSVSSQVRERAWTAYRSALAARHPLWAADVATPA